MKVSANIPKKSGPLQPTSLGDQWSRIYPLWMQFCGIADECQSIQDKWEFLRSDFGGRNAFLPNIGRYFRRLNDVVEFTGSLFSDYFGFGRSKLPNFADFERGISRWDATRAARGPGDIAMNPSMLHQQLSSYLLPMLALDISFPRRAFDQRTVSDEVPEHIARFSHSLERSFGNELFIAAADKLARCYVSTLTKDLERRERSMPSWDGIISLSYAGGENWVGASAARSPLTGLYHITLGEEVKYFPGSFVYMGHELGHIILTVVLPDKEMIFPEWYVQIREKMKRTSDGISLSSVRGWEDLYEQATCDAIGVKISGPGLIYAMSDLIPSPSTVFRIAFVRGFYAGDARFASIFQEELRSAFDYVVEANPDDEPTASLYLRLGGRLGQFTWEAQRRYLTDLAKLFPDRSLKRVLPLFDLPHANRNSSLLTAFLPNSPFTHDPGRDEDITRKLDRRIPVLDEQPRYIMHAYYTLYRRRKKDIGSERKPASYSATVQSLAYNKSR